MGVFAQWKMQDEKKENLLGKKKKIDFFNSENVSKFYYILNLYKFKRKINSNTLSCNQRVTSKWVGIMKPKE